MCVFCGRVLSGVVNAGGVLVGRCWVRLTAVSATRRAGVEVASSPAQNPSSAFRNEAALWTASRDKTVELKTAEKTTGEIPPLIDFFPVLFLLRRFTSPEGVCNQGPEGSR